MIWWHEGEKFAFLVNGHHPKKIVRFLTKNTFFQLISSHHFLHVRRHQLPDEEEEKNPKNQGRPKEPKKPAKSARDYVVSNYVFTEEEYYRIKSAI